MPGLKSFNRLGWVISPAALVIMRTFARVTHAKRSRIALFDQSGRLLLVRSWVGTQLWELPGGGARRHEQMVDAAVRELREETGITLTADDCRYLGEFRGVTVFSAAVSDDNDKKINLSWEITEYQWASVKKIPSKSDPFVAWACQKVSNQR